MEKILNTLWKWIEDICTAIFEKDFKDGRFLLVKIEYENIVLLLRFRCGILYAMRHSMRIN